MRVDFTGPATDRDDVNHVSVKSDGTVVLRYSDHKEYVDGDNYLTFDVHAGR